MKKIYLALFLFFFKTLSVLAQPVTAAPDPTAASADVISVYSNTYTDLAGTDFFPNWGQSTVVTEISIGVNTIKKMENCNYQGTQFASPINASTMQYLHIDIWTPNCTAFELYLINPGPVEQKVTVTPSNTGWNSYDIALSQYTAINLANIIQFKYVSIPFGGTTIYYDNVYFWKVANAPTLSNFSIPAQVMGAAPFTITAPTSNSAGAFTYSSSNTSVATISGNTVTITGIGTSVITANQAAAGAYSAGMIATTLTVTPAAAPTPTVAAANVISLFSNAYTNVSIDTWRTSWSPAAVTLTDLQIAGNDTKLYTNLSFVGVEFTGANVIDATNMQYYHVDVFTPNATTFKVKLVDFGADGVFSNGGDDRVAEIVVSPLTQSGWNSYNIPLTDFVTAGLATRAHLAQMLFEAVPFGSTTAYIDNIYFYNVPNAPTLSNFSIPTQVIGAAPFTITAPTSNSSGAFTYSSSNTSVATIAGNTISIIGIGTSVITATQAAAGAYSAGVITTTLTVTPAAAPTPTVAAATVISLFSNSYTNVSIDTWRTSWSPTAVTLTDLQIAGNDTKLYTNLSFVGVEFTGANLIDATNMQYYHVDVYTPNATTFNIKLVDIGANGIFGGGDDVEHEYTVPTLSQSGWNSYHIPLSAFTNLVTRAHLAQMIFSAAPVGAATTYIDNVYFTNAAVLPISLSTFTANANKNTVALNWSTLNESNNKGFSIERSTDGLHFTSLGFVNGKGNSTAKTNYASTDNTPVIGINYYRLKQMDLDGRFTYSPIATVKFSKTDLLGFSFFPNPATDVLKINIGLIENENATIKLVNNLGQTIISQNIRKSNSASVINFNISNIASGNYYLELKDGANKITEKVLVN